MLATRRCLARKRNGSTGTRGGHHALAQALPAGGGSARPALRDPLGGRRGGDVPRDPQRRLLRRDRERQRPAGQHGRHGDAPGRRQPGPARGPGAHHLRSEMYLGIRNVDCSGVTVSGSGLPASTDVTVTLLDAASRDRLEGQALTTSASGAFLWRARVSLSGLRTVRAVVARTGASTPIAWADHQVPTACPLVNTGAGPVLPLVETGLSSIVAGVLLLTAFAYKGRHLGVYRGRHVAAR